MLNNDNLKKINENVSFLNDFNYIVEYHLEYKEIRIIDIFDILDLINIIQKELIIYYMKNNLFENVISILKNISYKKVKEIKELL